MKELDYPNVIETLEKNFIDAAKLELSKGNQVFIPENPKLTGRVGVLYVPVDVQQNGN
jgi:hypothetical protein